MLPENSFDFFLKRDGNLLANLRQVACYGTLFGELPDKLFDSK
jgi:hypothetical protein